MALAHRTAFERWRAELLESWSLALDSAGALYAGTNAAGAQVSHDRGATWTKWGTDADKQSPFEVDIDGEGLYGFRIVIISRSGIDPLLPQLHVPSGKDRQSRSPLNRQPGVRP